MQVERITAGTFTAIVCRPTSHAAPGGCVVVYDGVGASTVPCLFLTETTARQLVELLGAICVLLNSPAENDSGGSRIETEAKPP